MGDIHPRWQHSWLARFRSSALTLDAIHLQGAQQTAAVARDSGLPNPVFIGADARLPVATQALGFATDTPLNHP